MTRTATGPNAVKAIAAALNSAFALADTPERRRDLLVLTEMVYLRLHAVNTSLGETFHAEMRPQPGGTLSPLSAEPVEGA